MGRGQDTQGCQLQREEHLGLLICTHLPPLILETPESVPAELHSLLPRCTTCKPGKRKLFFFLPSLLLLPHLKETHHFALCCPNFKNHSQLSSLLYLPLAHQILCVLCLKRFTSLPWCSLSKLHQPPPYPPASFSCQVSSGMPCTVVVLSTPLLTRDGSTSF